MVCARSAGDTPVVVSTWSTVTVNAVSWLSVFFVTITGIPRRSKASRLIGVHTIPRAYLTKKLMFSLVANSAAMIKSPSFSLLSSSTIITGLPTFIS